MDAMDMWDSQELADVENYLDLLIDNLPAGDEHSRAAAPCNCLPVSRCTCHLGELAGGTAARRQRGRLM